MKRVNRKLSSAERRRHAQIRAGAMRDFPPRRRAIPAATNDLPASFIAARKRHGLTWYALAQRAGISNQATIRDIEQGKDVKLSSLEAVARALGLKLELVAEASS